MKITFNIDKCTTSLENGFTGGTLELTEGL